jgi:hypothetical protein
MLTRWTLYNYSAMPDPRGFLRFVLGIGLLTIISGILFQNKGFCSICYPDVLFSHWIKAQRFVWEVILGICWWCCLFHQFFRELTPKEEVFKFTTPICPCLPSNVCCHILHATTLWTLYSKTWGFGFKARGAAGHVSSVTYFSNLLEDNERRLKTTLTLNLILQVNLRLGGYSIWSASLIAPHIKKTGQLLGA